MSVATISCHGNEALCERLGVDHGTYYFKDGVIDVKSGEVRVAPNCACAAASSSVSLSLSMGHHLCIVHVYTHLRTLLHWHTRIMPESYELHVLYQVKTKRMVTEQFE